MSATSYEFDEGYDWFGPDTSMADCPYPENTEEESLWCNGYWKAQMEYQEDILLSADGAEL